MDKKVIENEIKWHADNIEEFQKPAKINVREINKYRHCDDWKINPKQRLFHELGDLKGKYVLDFGSGQGLNGVEMALLGARVDGFDLSPELVRASRQLARINNVEHRCKFYIAEATSLDLKSDVYDIVLIYNVLHHIPYKDFPGVLKKIKQAVKPGGKIIMREPVALSPFVFTLKKIIPLREPTTPDERELDRRDLKSIVKHLGDVQIHYFGLFSRFAKHYGGEGFQNITMKVDRVLFGAVRPLKAIAGTVVMVYEKNGR